MSVNNETNQAAGQAAGIHTDGSVADFVLAHPELRPLLERLGIDYCCGGKEPFAQVIRDAGHDLQAVLAEARAMVAEAARRPPATDWASAAVTELARHIVGKHHSFTRTQLARVDGLLAKVQRAHARAHGAMLEQVRGSFDALNAELIPHLDKEEQILFPAIEAIDAHLAGRGGRPVIHCGSVANPIRQMELEHDSAGALLAILRKTTDGYRLLADACASFEALFEALPALENDLHEHIHLENNILFPRSLALEEQMEG